MEQPYTACMENSQKGFPFIGETDKQQSPREKRLLFSSAAQDLVTRLLQGKVEVFNDDIGLEISDGKCEAIRISERLSSNADFQKMWISTPCQSMLKQLAQTTLKQ